MLNGYPDDVLDIFRRKYANPKTEVLVIPNIKGCEVILKYIGKPDRQLEQEHKGRF